MALLNVEQIEARFSTRRLALWVIAPLAVAGYLLALFVILIVLTPLSVLPFAKAKAGESDEADRYIDW
ncbi:hypothetical protein [Neorhizobium sp. NCHU2750]|uniref:hypothetical protein n=1 Tax=Neorhizobium sp. NCHU2750 TaxID=1825976 RepID=UPI000E7608AA|nr:hypothetical protein NCHU2750_11580 [Neorhizobium sp. NCHU2750]